MKKNYDVWTSWANYLVIDDAGTGSSGNPNNPAVKPGKTKQMFFYLFFKSWLIDAVTHKVI